jgi:glycosyltransferase involved in cell wall biosynthesis
MRIAFVTIGASDDVSEASGTPYFMSNGFANAGEEVVRVQGLLGARSISLRLRDIFRTKVLRENYSTYRHPRRLELYAQQIEAHVKHIKPDVIISPSTLPIAYLNSDIPIVFWADATFAGLLDFYPEYMGVSREGVREGNAAEEAALRRCSAALYSSAWAAQTAIENYNVDPQKVHMVNFGANIPVECSEQGVASACAQRRLDRCELLFIGVDWVRKGGAIAVDVAVELNRRGLPTKLKVVGCAPPISTPLPSCVELIGFIDKATAEGQRKISQLFSSSSFLILPSRSECCAMVFAEANSAGLPVLASDVGGVSSAITHGVNGYLVPVGERADEVHRYCNEIVACMSSGERYHRLAENAFREYRLKLNWRVATDAAMKIIEQVLDSKPAATAGVSRCCAVYRPLNN